MVPSSIGDVKCSSILVAITSANDNAIKLETPVGFDAIVDGKDFPTVNLLAAAEYDPRVPAIACSAVVDVGNATDGVGTYMEDNDDPDDDGDDDEYDGDNDEKQKENEKDDDDEDDGNCDGDDDNDAAGDENDEKEGAEEELEKLEG